MTWNIFPVSRERFNEVKAERDKAREDYAKLMNQVIWRLTRIPLDPSLLPEDYRESVVPKKPDPGEAFADPKPEVAAAPNARAKLKDAEEKRMKLFADSHVGRVVEITKEA